MVARAVTYGDDGRVSDKDASRRLPHNLRDKPHATRCYPACPSRNGTSGVTGQNVVHLGRRSKTLKYTAPSGLGHIDRMVSRTCPAIALELTCGKPRGERHRSRLRVGVELADRGGIRSATQPHCRHRGSWDRCGVAARASHSRAHSHPLAICGTLTVLPIRGRRAYASAP
jgi:hypothetical protein